MCSYSKNEAVKRFQIIFRFEECRLILNGVSEWFFSGWDLFCWSYCCWLLIWEYFIVKCIASVPARRFSGPCLDFSGIALQYFYILCLQQSLAGNWRILHHVQSGDEAALKFFTGYIIEKSLSLDNIFVIAIIFTYFKVPALYQHRVLYWGILGALVMRGIMIFTGIALINRFSWMIYLLGILLILTALKMLFTQQESVHPDKNMLVRLARKLYPVTRDYEGSKFFSRIDHRRGSHPAVPGFTYHRKHRCSFRYRLYSCHLRYNHRSVYCFHLQRVCNSRSALPLFCPGFNDG